MTNSPKRQASPILSVLPTTTSQDMSDAGARIAALPVGSFEQHGPALPLVTDTLVACLIGNRLQRDFDLFLLPPISISCSHEHRAFAGTVSISSQTLSTVIRDVAESLKENGVEKLVVVNAHGGNHVLSNVVHELNADGPNVTLFPNSGDWNQARHDAGLTSNAHDDMHAGELEASILLHGAPDFVRADYGKYDHDARERPFLGLLGMQGYTETGVIGFPSQGSADKGRLLLDSLSRSFAKYFEELS